jgi:drug/metabolite transporter (DMT)-like permease
LAAPERSSPTGHCWWGLLRDVPRTPGFFISLKHLSVIGQSLIFSLLLSVSALLALIVLKERLPKGFILSLVLITAGLVLSSRAMGGMADGGGDDLLGIVMVLISVLAYAIFDISNRSLEGLDLGQGITLGIGAIVSTLIFALIEIGRFGAHYFWQLELWWVLGMIGGYGLLVRLVGGIAQRGSLLYWPVATVELWGSLAVVVSVFSATVVWVNHSISSRWPEWALCWPASFCPH